jgi:hypothetical protein
MRLSCHEVSARSSSANGSVAPSADAQPPMKGTVMARIVVQSDDYRTVLDERHVRLAEINECLRLLDRPEQGVMEAESPPTDRAGASRACK